MIRLIPVSRVRDEFPGWPFSCWTTSRLIREGKLAAVRVGRKHYLTAEILTEFVSRLTLRAHLKIVDASKTPGGKTVVSKARRRRRS